jgi:beta-lactamase regulating signal transducer with metallopeptidase domain
MKKTSIAGVWLVVVVAALAETILYYQSPDVPITEAVIGVIAAAAAVLTVAFSMGLKDEDGVVHYMVLVPVLLLAVLIITMLFAYPVNF